MKTSEVLRAARAKIEKPEQWWQSIGHNYHARHECTCFGLAISEACGGDWQARGAANDLVCRVLDTPNGGCAFIHKFNDTHTHAEVLALADKAIHLAEQEEGAEPHAQR